MRCNEDQVWSEYKRSYLNTCQCANAECKKEDACKGKRKTTKIKQNEAKND